MTDLTPLFDNLLSSHSAPPTTKHTFSVDSLDEFLQEAYTINNAIRTLHTDLLRIRQSYLSTAQPRRTLINRQNGERPLTDRDREEIDANSKTLLRDLNAKIRQLADAEQVRRETEVQLLKKKFAKGLSALGSWASGGANGGLGGKSLEYRHAEEAANSVNTHRESVLWTLRQRLQECVKTQQDMMEVRLNRELEKQRSVLARAGVGEGMGMGAMPGISAREPSSPVSKRRSSHAAWQGDEQPAHNPQEDLSAEQIQMFERENNDMLQHYESVLGQVRTAEKSLVEISELQTQLVNNLATQSAHIDQLVADSENITEDVGGGNKQLKQASQKTRPAKYTFYATCGICTLLVAWDLLI
ncbi:hypothetical protein BKA67DRAFT_641975 [Truncatella angustata]|uniref:t-SNARE coiled-coil homology domain-containing protein n=1 Tax=Truncatella angustata TaxID=152316 RepID=A0A9P9A5K7_9PEZI|nr:uncharacterized protein BKA67DRAFT_641975 [Truncatella angustata]KAH6660949.1 hypothetical protein BKA67DRAFT_641975 [Truncatella angustata]KAH8194900.1 hypothetical protein TruAng_010923 [Truncatella angustata]